MSCSSTARPIFVYNARWCVHDECVDDLCAHLNQPNIVSDESQMEAVLALKSPGTLVIPGGRTYVLAGNLKSLVGKTHAAVLKGWNYWGGCSGGNFGCELMADASSPKLGLPTVNHAKTPFLGLLPVLARFPVLEQVKDWKVIQVETLSEKPFACYWGNGSCFELLRAPASASLAIEAVYTGVKGNPYAAISGKCGEGKVFISGIHPEKPVPNETTGEQRLKFLDQSFAHVGIARKV